MNGDMTMVLRYLQMELTANRVFGAIRPTGPGENSAPVLLIEAVSDIWGLRGITVEVKRREGNKWEYILAVVTTHDYLDKDLLHDGEMLGDRLHIFGGSDPVKVVAKTITDILGAWR